MANLQILSVPALAARCSQRQCIIRPGIIATIAGMYALFSIKVANQWEKCAVRRFGRYKGLRGPGIFHVVPAVETIRKYVDQRVRVTDVRAETALTSDTLPVNVDAIVFWVVWDAEKTILEVQDFFCAVTLAAQTALLESIGRHELGQMIKERESLGHHLQHILEERPASWGITIHSVQIHEYTSPVQRKRKSQRSSHRRPRSIKTTPPHCTCAP